MERRILFRKAITSYNAVVALLFLYLIVTSLAFSCEKFFGAVPDGAYWVFGVVGLVFAVRVFILRMADASRKADRLSLQNNKDLAAFAAVIVFGLLMCMALIWGWIKIYPQF